MNLYKRLIIFQRKMRGKIPESSLNKCSFCGSVVPYSINFVEEGRNGTKEVPCPFCEKMKIVYWKSG